MRSVIKPVIGITFGALLVIGFTFGTLFVAGSAHAHYLWIEHSTDGPKLYFGEAEALLKEKSPGKLDSIKAPQAFVMDEKSGNYEAVSIKREAEYFAIDHKKGASAVVIVEESLDVRDLSKNALGFAKSNYYARHHQPAIENSTDSPLALDVQGSKPNQLTVLYRGQPLKDAKLYVIAPNTWMQEHETNSRGMVNINTPWRGQYVVHVVHVDKTPGEFAGKKYDTLRNHLTYSFIQKDGAKPGLAIPPKHAMD